VVEYEQEEEFGIVKSLMSVEETSLHWLSDFAAVNAPPHLVHSVRGIRGRLE